MFMYAVGTLPLIVILEDGHSCGMLMMLKLLLVELCQNFMIGLIYFPHVIPGLAIIG